MMSLSVRENAAISALRPVRPRPLVEPRRGSATGVDGVTASLSVRAPSHGGAGLGAVRRQPAEGRASPVRCCPSRRSCSADEPTQGVDVGARAEIYAHPPGSVGPRRPGGRRLLRRQGARGALRPGARDVARSRRRHPDGRRGHRGAHRLGGGEPRPPRSVRWPPRSARRPRGLRRFILGDYAPTVLLRLRDGGCSLRTAPENDRYLSAFNITNLLTAATALGFIALGQNIALLTGGIDLSVGPLAGFLVVIASFFVNDGKSLATSAARAGADARGRGVRRARQRLADPVRASSPRSRRRWRLHRPRWVRVPAAVHAGRLHQPSPSSPP